MKKYAGNLTRGFWIKSYSSISLHFFCTYHIYIFVCLFIFFSFSFLWDFVKVVIYTVALSDDFIFSCHRLGLNILLTFGLFLIGFTLSVFFVSLVKYDMHYLFILSRFFTFYFLSHSCYGLKSPLLRTRNLKKSNVKDERMREHLFNPHTDEFCYFSLTYNFLHFIISLDFATQLLPCAITHNICNFFLLRLWRLQHPLLSFYTSLQHVPEIFNILQL